ncbi:MAG: hypothetical protein JW913_03065 [Chitinispirillaceae bacterium]|nr:hypothetical protein [Chitinispirillaceae bacterium]
MHSEGRLLCIINHCFKSDKDKLFFTYTIFRHENLDKKEQDEIQNYIKKYGKPPVLNSAIPGKQDWFQELIK